MIKSLAVSLVLLFSSSAMSQVQFSQSAETGYTLGLQSYRQGDYSTALLYFRQVMQDSLNQRSAEAYYYGARSLFNLREYSESAATVDTFLSRLPGDEHRFDMVYILGADYYELGQYQAAASEFILAVDSSGNQVTRDQAAASLHSLVSNNLGFADIEQLFETCHSRLSSMTVAIGFARRAYFSDKLPNVRAMLQEFLDRYPTPGIGSAEINRWMSRISADSSLGKAEVKIAALLPLEYGNGVGDRLLLGIQLALDDYNANASTKVGLVLKNYGGVMQKLYSDMLSITSDTTIKAIVGPVYSGDVSALAKVADQQKIAMISPTATQVGLTKNHPYVFQANPDFKTRAEAMADYAVNVLHAKRIAILAPTDAYGKTISEYFTNRLDSLGVPPLAVAYFQSGTTDLSLPIEEIKSAAALEGEPYVNIGRITPAVQQKIRPLLPPAYVDSLGHSTAAVDAYDLFGKDPVRVADSLGVPVTIVKSLGDFDALRSLDAIFVPLTSSKDIGVLGAQLAYYNIKTQLIGTDDWYDLNQLSTNDAYIDGVIFCSDTYLNTSDGGYAAVTDSLSQISDAELDRTIAYGYDVTNAILNLIRTGNLTRSSIQSSLKGEVYQGLHSTISFGDDNSNRFLHILQFTKGAVVDLGEVNPK